MSEVTVAPKTTAPEFYISTWKDKAGVEWQESLTLIKRRGELQWLLLVLKNGTRDYWDSFQRRAEKLEDENDEFILPYLHQPESFKAWRKTRKGES